jgi:hypothetical protein
MVRRLVIVMIGAGMLVATSAMTAAAEFPKKGACKIITEDDIEEIFGTAPTNTVQDLKKGKYTTCTWKVATATGGEATVFVGIDKTSKIALKDFAERRKSPTAEKVAGIKKGFVDENTVTFVKDGSFVNVQYLGPTTDEVDSEGLTDLATNLYDEL